MANKIPVSEFCEKTGKNIRQVRRLWTIHPRLKCKVPGEKSCRVNMEVWEKIMKTA